MKRLLKRMLTIVFGTVGLLVVLLLLFQGRLIYYPRGYTESFLRSVDAEPLSFTTSQGRQVAWLTPKVATEAEHVWLVFCGNGTVTLDLEGYFEGAALNRDRFVLFDYPAYGQCEGRPSPGSIRESIKALLPALATKLGTTSAALRPRLRVFGHSLGCAAALIAMEEHGIRQGLLVAPFTRMLDLGRLAVGWPLSRLLLHRFDNVATLQRLKAGSGARLQVFHGTDDEVIPFAMGAELAARFPGMVTFEAVPGARHNDILDLARTRIAAAMARMQ